LEMQLCQQIQNKRQIEIVHAQLVATVLQLKQLQQQNFEQSTRIVGNELLIRETCESASRLQSEHNQVASLCDDFVRDIRVLREALVQEEPARFGYLRDLPIEPAPKKLPTFGAEAELASHLQNHAETALALLSTVAANNSSSNDPKWNDANGSDSGSSACNGSSNNSTEDTAVCTNMRGLSGFSAVSGSDRDQPSESKGSDSNGDQNDSTNESNSDNNHTKTDGSQCSSEDGGNDNDDAPKQCRRADVCSSAEVSPHEQEAQDDAALSHSSKRKRAALHERKLHVAHVKAPKC